MPSSTVVFNGGADSTGNHVKFPISAAIAKVAIAARLVLKLLELQQVTIAETDKDIISEQLKKLGAIDLLMIACITPTQDNISDLNKGIDLIGDIKSTLQRLIKPLPDQSDILTARGIIKDAINDMDSSIKQIEKKISGLKIHASQRKQTNLTPKP